MTVFHHNTITSDSYLGKCTIFPANLPEGQLIDQWVPLEDKPNAKKRKEYNGDVHLKMLRSLPILDTFTFMVRQRALSFGDFSITELSGRKVFSVEGSWPSSFYLKDLFGRQVVTIKRRSLIAFEPSYDFYQPGILYNRNV
jgi:hypothetical protein